METLHISVVRATSFSDLSVAKSEELSWVIADHTFVSCFLIERETRDSRSTYVSSPAHHQVIMPGFRMKSQFLKNVNMRVFSSFKKSLLKPYRALDSAL